MAGWAVAKQHEGKERISLTLMYSDIAQQCSHRSLAVISASVFSSPFKFLCDLVSRSLVTSTLAPSVIKAVLLYADIYN